LPTGENASKVLIYRTGSLGDMLVALPSLHLVARAFPHAERVLLTSVVPEAKASDPAAILRGTGLIHDFLYYTGGTRSIAEMLRLAAQIRRFRPVVLVYLLQPRTAGELSRDRKFLRLAGVRRMVGMLNEEELKNRFDPSTGLYESEAARLGRAIAELGEANADDLDNWDLHLSAAEKGAAARALGELREKPLIACAPGCKMQANDWEQHNWRALLGRISATYPSWGLLMAGGKADVETCEYAALDWAGPKVNLAGRLTPRESAAAFSYARLFIGPDSGPKHLAASVGVPCVCVFSARGKPGMWFPPGRHSTVIYHEPECRGCNLETCIEMQKKCIRSVTVDEMEQAVHRVLRDTIASAS
jgi:heptosyltransferase III